VAKGRGTPGWVWEARRRKVGAASRRFVWTEQRLEASASFTRPEPAT